MKTNHWKDIARVTTIAVASATLVISGAALANRTGAESFAEKAHQHSPHHGNHEDHNMGDQHSPHHGNREDHDMGDHADVESELDYLVHMIPHHEEAIEAAKILRDRTERPEMQAFAEEIIETQTAEIEQIESWLEQWHPERDRATEYEPMMRDLSDLEGDELDQVFLEDMIIHHMGAVMQSRMLLQQELVENEPVGELAQDIAQAQRDEIHQMQSWLQDWFDVDSHEVMREQMHQQRHDNGNGDHH
ncbi:DUF305 domain-containing protein [Euhalothece natronophila Z-M001]|uniref:DUF305 domain-containing protein n=1 Tax=Euhalothece natronophila Z-M001 TaxID=522448 RepID=A0A5B8NLC6_9CHRO|nr:DUF305 domain-containing protein [Euhalothece natronophila]QDZ39331.1 DUF305 domain-containing protein [Euhalothece natronophila Z-M001]